MLDCDSTAEAAHRNPVGQPRRRRHRARHVPPGFFSVAALAALGPLSRAGIYREIACHRLPAHRWRGRIVVAAEAFDRWLKPDAVVSGDAMAQEARNG